MSHSIDIKKLEKLVTDVSDALAHLATPADWKHLITIIRKPGWTTEPEYRFAVAILGSLQGQAEVLLSLKKQLLSTSELVGSKEVRN
jgi:hypothetical protein